MAFETKIRRARFVVGPFSAESMATIGQVTADSVVARIRRGVNVQDAAAKPLKPGRNGHRGYPDYKVARGLQGIRDWVWRGKTMRSLKVKSANENRVVIGFVDPEADRIAHFNNQREKQFGLSPKDETTLKAVVLAAAKQARVAAPAVAMPAGIGGLSLPSISAPAVSGAVASVLTGGGGGGSRAMAGTSAGIPTFMGGAAGSTAAGGGILPMLLRAGQPGSGGAAGGTGIAGILKNFKGMNWGGFTHGPDVYSTDANGSDVESQGKITGVNGVAGAALFTSGTMLAQQGLLGSSRGTWGGMAMGGIGGAAIGFQMGGPLGAAIGGAAGLGIGLGEKIAGVESPENEAKRLVKSLYSVNIDTALAKQIVSIAQSKYAGHVSIAVRDPDVRKMLELYAQGTGQKMPLSATTPRGGSLAEQGGNLYQQATYTNGVANLFQSNLPVMGSGGGTYPTPGSPNTAAGMGPMSVSLNINGADAQAFIQGQMVTPQFVTDQSLSAQNSGYNRVQQSANMQVPGLMVGT